MIPFPSQMITLKSGGNQMKFTHGRNPPSFPIENVQEGFWPLQLPIFYNGNGVGLRPWVNFVWSSPDFRVTIYDGNGHISPARKTRFGFDHILSHPIGEWLYRFVHIQLTPAITDLKGLTNFMRYWRIALLPKRLSSTIFFASFLCFKKQKEKPLAFQ